MAMEVAHKEWQEDYAKWVRKIRKDSKMTQEEFGKHVYRFEKWGEKKKDEGKEKMNEEYCRHYNRSSVINWERGRNLPVNIETFVCLAIMDYRIHGEADVSCYAHVQRQMQKYFNRRLYPRTINDALLMMAIRGLYAMEEIPEVRREINQLFSQRHINKAEKGRYALDSMTEDVELVLCRVQSKEAFMELVFSEEYWPYFYLGGRAVGEKLKEMYEDFQTKYGKIRISRNKSEQISFEDAVNIYVPKCRGSFNRIFSSDMCVSRQWLMDFCIHMRLDREDIQKVLGKARMVLLSDDKSTWESQIRELENASIGSVKWYNKMAQAYPEKWKIRYIDAMKLPVPEKLAFAVLISEYLEKMESIADEIMPVDYLLDCMFSMKVWTEIKKEMKSLVKTYTEQMVRNTESLLGKIYRLFADDFVCEIDSNMAGTISDRVKNIYDAYRMEFYNYFSVPKNKYRDEDRSVNKIYTLATVTYSLFTGKLYEKLYQEDLEELHKQLLAYSASMEQVYLFLNNLWVIFLGPEKLQKSSRGMFYCVKDQRMKKPMGWEEIKRDVIEAWVLAEKC